MNENIITDKEKPCEEAINPYSDNFDLDLFESRLRQNYTIDHPCEEEFKESNIKASIVHAKIENQRYHKNKNNSSPN
jgi:hypothetical protein